MAPASNSNNSNSSKKRKITTTFKLKESKTSTPTSSVITRASSKGSKSKSSTPTSSVITRASKGSAAGSLQLELESKPRHRCCCNWKEGKCEEVYDFIHNNLSPDHVWCKAPYCMKP